jgi:hypothetical protein
VRFIVVHDTGNPGASARAHARWYRNDPDPPPKVVSSAHLFVDDEEIVETIPSRTGAEQALHVLRNRTTDDVLYGVDANRAAIGVEYCFGGGIDAAGAYDRFVWVTAYLCDLHGLDPTRDVVGHQVLDPGRKTDPGNGLRRSGRSYERLLKDVVTMYRDCRGSTGNIDLRTGALKAAIGGQVITTVQLRLRAKPDTDPDTAVVEVLPPGRALVLQGVVKGETVSGNDDWCRIGPEAFCWSGGVKPG